MIRSMVGAGPRATGRPVRRIAAALAGAFLIASGAASVATAADDPTEGGLWYLSAPGVDAAHQRTTGEGVTIAVIDSPVNPEAPDLVGQNLITSTTAYCHDATGAPQPPTGTTEASEHATNMVSLIIGSGVGVDGQPGVRGVAPGATVRHYTGLAPEKDAPGCDIAPAVDQAVADGAQIISLSIGGTTQEPPLTAALGRAERAGLIVVTATGNEGGSGAQWPGSTNGVIAMAAGTVTGQRATTAWTSPLLSAVAPGVDIRANRWSGGAWNTYDLVAGSSCAAPWTAGVLALVWSAYPDATSNQIIQTLLRNTATGAGELARNDSWGYGPVSLGNMLTVDPAAYPDVNPLVRTDLAAQPPATDITTAPNPVPEPTATATTAPAAAVATADSPPMRPLLIVGAGLLVLLVVALAVVGIVLAARSRTRPAMPTTPTSENPRGI